MKTRFIALAVAATLGLGSVSAFAQGYRHDGRGEWQHQRAERGNWGYHNRDGYRRDDGDLAGALVLGALTGALIGQAQNNYSYDYAPPATYYTPPPATYYTPPSTYYAPPATYYTPAAPAYYGPTYRYYGD
jgi:hypothetical protein